MTPGTDSVSAIDHLVLVAGEGHASNGYVAALEAGPEGQWPERCRCTGVPGALAMASHPFLDRLYVAGSYAAQDHRGYVTVLGLPDLTPISSQPSRGRLPCYLSVDPSGRFLVVSNYLDGRLAVLRLTEDGDIDDMTDCLTHPGHGLRPDRQDRSHIHAVVFDPTGKHLLVTDLGTDRIHVYTLDPDGRLCPRSVTGVPHGRGPRHLAFVGTTTVVTTDELSSTVSWYDYEPEAGVLIWRGSEQTVDQTTGTNYPSDLVTTAHDTVCLIGNRGHDTIAVFAITKAGLTRTSELDTGGHWPQHLATIGDNVWFALRDSDRIRALHAMGTQVELLDLDIALPRPNWILEYFR